jgi:HEAT repeat protein
MKRFFILGLLLAAACLLFADDESRPIEEQQRDTIRFGTENEIAALIQTLKTENADYLDDELITLVQGTMNRSILTGVFTFFADREKGGLEDRALRALDEWDLEANDTVLAAVDYLGKVKAAAAVTPLKTLISAGEQRFLNNALRALGRIGGADSKDEIAGYLMDYYTDRIPADETRREIITALGESGSPEGVSFLADIAVNNEERATIRMAALESLSKIGDPAGLEAVLAGVSSQDPNVRSTAMAALGPFSGPEVDRAILEAFRDSFWRTRVGAAQAAGRRKLVEAVPYLGYRAERDDVPQVKDEAIRALGAIGNDEAIAILDTLFGNRRNADRVRILAAEMLIREHPDQYAGKVIVELDEAKTRNQTPLYNGLLRAISTAKTPGVEALTRRFLTTGGVIEKSYGLDMAANNDFRNLREAVEALANSNNGSLVRKARALLEKFDS